MRFFIAAAAGFALTACSTLNEGATDYRRATAADNGHMKLVQKLNGPGVPVRESDMYYVALTQAFINGFTESFDHQTLLYGERVGEIAIIIRAEEVKPGTELDLDYGSKLSDKKGRVVFFSNDVRQGQFLNFPTMPVLGPTKYEGGPIILDIYVVEIDADTNAQYSSMLSALATLGRDAFAASSPVIGILDTIGSKLLNGRESDDIEMHYSAVLLPAPDDAVLKNYAKLEVGDYLFVRLHDRSDDLAWSELRFDPNTARLVAKDPKCAPLDEGASPAVRTDDSLVDEFSQRQYDSAPVRDDECIFRGATYLTLQVNKGGFKETKLKAQTLKQLTDVLKQANVDYSAIAGDVKKILDDAEFASQQDKLRKLFNKVQDAKRTATLEAASDRYRAADSFLTRFKSAVIKADKKDKKADPFAELFEIARSEMENNSAPIAKSLTKENVIKANPETKNWKDWLTALSVAPSTAQTAPSP